MHDIRYDSLHDEIVVPNPFAQAVITFRGSAQGEERPIRVIQGPKTQMRHPDMLDIDPAHNEIFVGGNDSIQVFSREANGDAAPIRVIRGPKTGLRGANAMAVDPVHNVVVVPSSYGEERTPSLLIFNRTDQGDVAPRRVILGARTSRQLTIYSPRGWILANTATGSPRERNQMSTISVWSIHDNGNVPPRWQLGGPKSTLLRARGIGVNPKTKEVIVADMQLNAVLTYYFPEIF